MSTELVERLRAACIDWNDTPMQDAEEPRVILDCATMREAADGLTAITAKVALLTEALAKIAAFYDEAASRHLTHTGSYGAFDEPSSVEIARRALSEPDKEGT